ncbi:GNAT family N-acetyltransferase [Paucisalibacillus sp. EB02]|uniref:GNAT family N-acetyltransferase n=1 Tax=Paucisalibacillus sp. EB02 TaxID=1347087 RepID=UPI0004BB0CDC|nr:GNAT family N-acetyltransferase [Paucisalibacillus sp. EB02]
MDSNAVIIRPLSIDDFEEVLNWSKNDAFCIANDWELNRNSDELYDWWQRCVNHNTSDFIRLGIEWRNRLIGYADLANIKGNTAEFGVAIGESTLWGRGLGFHAANQFLDYVAMKYKISIVNAETHVTNLRSKGMLEKLGFQEISRIGFEKYKGVETQLIQYQLILSS